MKTNGNGTRNLGIRLLVENLQKLNKDAQFQIASDPSANWVIISSVSAEKLIFPEGYYWDNYSHITNEKNITSTKYESYRLYVDVPEPRSFLH